MRRRFFCCGGKYLCSLWSIRVIISRLADASSSEFILLSLFSTHKRTIEKVIPNSRGLGCLCDFKDIWQQSEQSSLHNKMEGGVRSRIGDGQVDEEHYRIEIRRLKQAYQKLAGESEKRIGELEQQLSDLRKQRQPIFKQPEVARSTDYEIYQKEVTIRELRQQNAALREKVNTPNQLLIKRPLPLDALEEKQAEINRLKKTLTELQGKFDGQYFTEHRLKKDYDMLLKDNQQLRSALASQVQLQQPSNNELQQPLQLLKANKELQAVRKENEVLRKALQDLEQTKTNTRVEPNRSRIFGTATLNEELKLQVEEYKIKNRELKKQVQQLKQENEMLRTQNRNKSLPNSTLPNSLPNSNVLISGIASNFNEEVPLTARKTGRYEEFGIREFDGRASSHV